MIAERVRVALVVLGAAGLARLTGELDSELTVRTDPPRRVNEYPDVAVVGPGWEVWAGLALAAVAVVALVRVARGAGIARIASALGAGGLAGSLSVPWVERLEALSLFGALDRQSAAGSTAGWSVLGPEVTAITVASVALLATALALVHRPRVVLAITVAAGAVATWRLFDPPASDGVFVALGDTATTAGPVVALVAATIAVVGLVVRLCQDTARGGPDHQEAGVQRRATASA